MTSNYYIKGLVDRTVLVSGINSDEDYLAIIIDKIVKDGDTMYMIQKKDLTISCIYPKKIKEIRRLGFEK
tara:strand:+ start:3493 stop:3702 length:210 start_codon:yes stop_codon:yes gene_type:complete